MIVRRIDEVVGTERDVETDTWRSCRLLVAKDGLPFSMHDTMIKAGTLTTMQYKHHVEAVYCLSGEGDLEVLPEGPHYKIRPGTLYALDRHERHILRAQTDLRMICVFNPPLKGDEVHDDDGAYPAPAGAGSAKVS